MKTTKFLKTKMATAMCILSGLVITDAASASAKLPASATAGMNSVYAVTRDTGPEIIRKSETSYPANALLESREGWAIVELDIDESGKASNIEIVDASNSRLFARHAKRLIKAREFVPATRDGKPVPVEGYKLRVRYELDEPAS